MIVGIDASNIRVGGGVTHLVELLRIADPIKSGIQKVVVFAGKKTLDRIEAREDWLRKVHVPDLDKGLALRMLWQRFRLLSALKDEDCGVLLVPGGVHSAGFSPIVAMSQNLLPFEWRELRRYGLSWMALKMTLLRFVQGKTFREAGGVIFLTNYAKRAVTNVVGEDLRSIAVIPLGIHNRFLASPKDALPILRYSNDDPFRLLYVSVIDVYKHQWHVTAAVAKLRSLGYPVVLDLVGSSLPRSLVRLTEAIAQVDPTGTFIRYRGPVAHEELSLLYRQCDVNVFASSCENMPNILIEAMASGLPIACSNRGPMSEVLRDAGVYFDPENPDEISSAIKALIDSPDVRAANAKKAFAYAQEYSWERCAEMTFAYLRDVATRD